MNNQLFRKVFVSFANDYDPSNRSDAGARKQTGSKRLPFFFETVHIWFRAVCAVHKARNIDYGQIL